MELRAGYKLTDVGALPLDWEVHLLGQIGRIMTGPFGTLLKANEYSRNEGVPVVSVGEVGDGTLRVTDQTPRVPEVVIRRLPQYVLRTGDVVFGRKGAVERSALVSAQENGWFLGSDGISVRPFVSCHPPYLAAQLRSARVKSWLLQKASGTTMPSLNQRVLGDVQVPLAPLSEQRRIAEVLSDVDALLDGLERLIAKKRDLKQAAMQQVLSGQTRLPGFRDDWQTKTLGTLCTMKSGEAITSAAIDSFSPYPCYGGNGLRGYASRFTHDGAFALIGRQGALCGNVIGVKGKFFASEHAVVVTAKSDIDIEWLTYVLGRMKLNQYSESSAQPGLSVSKILMLEVMVPPTRDEQAEIANVLSDMDAEIEALEQRRDKTRLLKQGMMQELLTGRTRLV